jgi:Fe-S-cluster-containing dehydrogenase component/DMSO reductase anchor subunit
MSGPGQFRLDLGRCTGCETCVLACRMAHRPAQSLAWRRVHTFNTLGLPDLPVFHLSLACHHCRQPACLEHCPAGAYRQDPATGAVIHQPERCLGCRYCTWVCPHDAPKFDPDRGEVAKCGFCLERQAQGLEPACVAHCPVQALGFEPRDGLTGGLPPGFPASRMGPAIHFVPGRRPLPVLSAPPEPRLLARCRRALLRVPEPFSARGEWALVAFTTTLAALVAVVATAAARAGRVLPAPLPHPGLLLWAGALCLALSACHLGHPGRAWRALGNLRGSWLSREVALVLMFLGLVAAGTGLPRVPGLTWAAAAAGFAALFAVDRVYQVALRTSRLDFHSAHALFNGLYLTGLLAGCWPLALAAGALKASLYLGRKAHFRRCGRPPRPALSLLRILLGFILPALAFGGGWAALAAVLGDLVDRWEFYGELSFPSPERQIALDLAPD